MNLDRQDAMHAEGSSRQLSILKKSLRVVKKTAKRMRKASWSAVKMLSCTKPDASAVECLEESAQSCAAQEETKKPNRFQGASSRDTQFSSAGASDCADSAKAQKQSAPPVDLFDKNAIGNMPPLADTNSIKSLYEMLCLTQHMGYGPVKKVPSKPEDICEKNRQILERVEKLLNRLIEAVKSVRHMKDASHIPVMLMFVLRQENLKLSARLKKAELDFNTPSVKSPEDLIDMNKQVIEYYIAESMEPTICIEYWISCKPSLEEAYSTLHNDIAMALVMGKRAEGTMTESTINFYREVLLYIRAHVSQELCEMEIEQGLTFCPSETFKGLVTTFLHLGPVREFLEKKRLENTLETSPVPDEMQSSSTNDARLKPKRFASSFDSVAPETEAGARLLNAMFSNRSLALTKAFEGLLEEEDSDESIYSDSEPDSLDEVPANSIEDLPNKKHGDVSKTSE
ncbi:uncharacterized protein NEMAJ01_0152 [Nematocida major]|uniref:uncharacterized protein n=1 Tax=Nematocida major TaxID=1912982 RepID=UPI00200852F3|nr:uncharacterized protein NEMAJ01_0152 [Nematocida major]KAH9385256.1 hypothetical protein NEMAJ01_0152 [Nematocida major]